LYRWWRSSTDYDHTDLRCFSQRECGANLCLSLPRRFDRIIVHVLHRTGLSSSQSVGCRCRRKASTSWFAGAAIGLRIKAHAHVLRHACCRAGKGVAAAGKVSASSASTSPPTPAPCVAGSSRTAVRGIDSHSGNILGGKFAIASGGRAGVSFSKEWKTAAVRPKIDGSDTCTTLADF
jgi:hypothetical protein